MRVEQDLRGSMKTDEDLWEPVDKDLWETMTTCEGRWRLVTSEGARHRSFRSTSLGWYYTLLNTSPHFLDIPSTFPQYSLNIPSAWLDISRHFSTVDSQVWGVGPLEEMTIMTGLIVLTKQMQRGLQYSFIGLIIHWIMYSNKMPSYAVIYSHIPPTFLDGTLRKWRIPAWGTLISTGTEPFKLESSQWEVPHYPTLSSLHHFSLFFIIFCHFSSDAVWRKMT